MEFPLNQQPAVVFSRLARDIRPWKGLEVTRRALRRRYQGQWEAQIRCGTLSALLRDIRRAFK